MLLENDPCIGFKLVKFDIHDFKGQKENRKKIQWIFLYFHTTCLCKLMVHLAASLFLCQLFKPVIEKQI